MTAGIVLAAGESSRFGRCKATLPVGSTHLLGLALDALAGAELFPLVVVAGRYQSEIEHAVGTGRVHVAYNPDWRQGQITSLQCGLTMAGSDKPVIVALADHPGFSVSLVRRMMEVYEAENVAGVVPVFKGQSGHPVLFGPEMIKRLRRIPCNRSARDVVGEFADRVRHLETDEEAVVRDLDTEEDYQEFLRIWREKDA